MSYIGREASKIAVASVATQRTIPLLRERRAAIIAAAVTGQMVIPITAGAAEA